MRRDFSSAALALTLAVASAGVTAANANAAVLYDSTVVASTSAKAAVLVRPHLPPNSGDTNGIGEGDDYSTSYSSLNITGLSFNGSVGASTTFSAKFYDSTQALLYTIMPAAGELTSTTGIQTFGAADFGANGITVPGNGYVVFSVVSSDGVNRPSFNLGYEAGAPTIGSNNFSSAVRIDYQGNFTTGAFFNGIDPTSNTSVPTDVAEIQLTGTGIVPEPASLGILVPAALTMLRRRRAARPL